MKKIGVIGIPGGWSSEKLADSVAERTGFRLLVDPSSVRLDLPSGRAMFGEVELNSLDGLIIKKIGRSYSPDLLDRLEVFRFLAEQGMPIFSKPMSIIRVLDRLSCTITLQLTGIPMPPLTITEDVDAALDAVTTYGEAVFKPLYSTKARGMFVLQPGPEARAIIERHKAEHRIMYIQKKIELNGRDLGVVFLGGQYLTTYARTVRNDAWNTTTASGGKYQPHEPSQEIIALAHKAQAPFGLDFTCVDVVETADGPMVFEVSAFGGFRGIQEACGINAARHYADYVCGRIMA
ncbi:GAK system ATP-grasp enzyme [Thiovibrio frasassiensis]|uniref:GAK system ATP-grasp enzyme n=1 Tax=Thiovibrio frasassiensis TaxID=2984131 RepID=A0A9X4MHX6_9BACT|nr:GAK system ATP-grasp enzyme [Thiovibrio frasassiensis]MDG4476185.1 GAK system ATP-grasp enzyme [Thiovibrio frasassiensis]